MRGLTFWAYSVLSKSLSNADKHNQRSQSISKPASAGRGGFVRLDGEDSSELQRFLLLGKGIPSILRWTEAEGTDAENEVPLSDPISVMNAITSLLWKKNGDDEKRCPPLVVNLSKLMSSLGSAAAGMRRR